MVSLKLYRQEIALLSKPEVIEERKKLMKVIDGDAFFPLKLWPKEMRLIFWKKPPSDTETFKLVPFLLGNGCAPTLIARWIMLAQYWAESIVKAEKRARQVDFISLNEDTKKDKWFYFDMDYNKILFLNGLPKQK